MNEIIQDIALPVSVERAYDLPTDCDVRYLSGGQVNETLLVDAESRQLILRKLSPLLGTLTIHKTFTIANHLADRGWEAPLIEPTIDNKPYMLDENGNIWHGMRYIASDGAAPAAVDNDFIGISGQLLGKWHRDVQDLQYLPESIPHFHDTGYIAHKITEEMPLLSADEKDLAHIFLRELYQISNALDLSANQIIHGDPKLDNMLYRSGEPFTLIDLDCSLTASRWLDIGDFLRSAHGKVLSNQLTHSGTPEDMATAFMEGYSAEAREKTSLEQSVSEALTATKMIATELGLRYLSDIVDGAQYFSWDQTRYQTRQEALYDKAFLQLSVVDEMTRQLNER